MIENQQFERIHLNDKTISAGTYENCTFLNCDFSNGNLYDFKFEDCEFFECNFSLAHLAGTAFRNVHFKDCKMLGLHFDDCAAFGLAFSFENCTLNHSSFYKLKIKQTKFLNCSLVAVDFTETDLTQSNLRNQI
jgi:uncharacterized protein YjbI with pentapeptide repeats